MDTREAGRRGGRIGGRSRSLAKITAGRKNAAKARAARAAKLTVKSDDAPKN